MNAALLASLRALAVLAVALSGLWAALFLWFRVPGGPALAGAAAGFWVVLTLAALPALWTGRPLPVLLYGAAFLGLVVSFASIPARDDRDWAADVARPLRATVAGDQVTVETVRNFDWRTEAEFTPRWESRRYDLADLRTVDLVNSYWAGPVIAHTLLSFGFADGRSLTFSVEIRRERGESYSSLAGFFKQYELVYVAADERDIVRLRATVRGEDVRLFRLRLRPDEARAGFLELLRRGNALADRPAFYHSAWRNCTTEMFGAARVAVPGLPFDWRIIASGFLPDYAYDLGALDRRFSLAELRDRGRVPARVDEGADYSAAIRVGLPDPNAAPAGPGAQPP